MTTLQPNSPSNEQHLIRLISVLIRKAEVQPVVISEFDIVAVDPKRLIITHLQPARAVSLTYDEDN